MKDLDLVSKIDEKNLLILQANISNITAMEPFAFGYLSSLGGIEFKDPTTPDKELLAGTCPVGEQEPKLRCYTTDVYVVENVSTSFSITLRFANQIIAFLRLIKV